MLKQRILTALVLLAILLPALFYPDPAAFAGVVLVLMAGAAWEWGRLNGCSFAASLALSAVCVALCAAAWLAGWAAQPLTLLWTLAAGVWVLGSAWLLRAGVPGWPRIPRALRLVLGVLGLWLAWLAVVQARVIGINFLLSVMTLVWMADIAAYWEGVWGGMAGVLLLGLCWVVADAHWEAAVPSLYSRLWAQGAWLLLLGALFMACMSVVGDLIESLVKRSAGAKDSSNLLPGHGGVLDRVDALLPTLPIAMMLTRLVS